MDRKGQLTWPCCCPVPLNFAYAAVTDVRNGYRRTLTTEDSHSISGAEPTRNPLSNPVGGSQGAQSGWHSRTGRALYLTREDRSDVAVESSGKETEDKKRRFCQMLCYPQQQASFSQQFLNQSLCLAGFSQGQCAVTTSCYESWALFQTSRRPGCINVRACHLYRKLERCLTLSGLVDEGA